MTETDLIKLVLEQTDGYLDFPFNRPDQKATVIFSVIKHHSNNKIIAMVYTQDGQVLIDVKLMPAQNEALRLSAGVEPGRHLNNRYWTTIRVNETVVSTDELKNIISESARLTR
jgi:predicted DNA-binding protein (MmcQ/YjbR family)